MDRRGVIGPTATGGIACATLWAVLLLAGCRSTPTPDEWRPHESLLTILAELELHRGEDLYRFGYPHDVTGQNVFRATLVRLENWQVQWPGRWVDIVTHARALCHEALGDHALARDLFAEVAAMETDLAPEAERHREAMERFAALDAFEPRERTLALHILELEEHVERWRLESQRRRGTEWEDLAMIGWEQAAMQVAEVLKEVAPSLPDGEQRYRQWCRDLIEDHSESHRIHRHWLRLGDHHVDLARRLVVFSPPQTAAFDLEAFEELIGVARGIYMQVERADGFPEKREARARLAALESFAERVRDDAR